MSLIVCVSFLALIKTEVRIFYIVAPMVSEAELKRMAHNFNAEGI